jgi:hypothetical protein
MKNKLLTSALVGSLSLIGLAATQASAQTTVSGNMAITYGAVSADNSTVLGNSYQGFGRETQLNIANKGKLNVADLSYAAGFSLEFDGGDTNNSDQTQENMYIDFISGNTTITVGSDHIQNSDINVTNFVGIGYIRPDGIGNVDGTYPAHNSPYGNNGIGITQTIPTVGALSFYYAPNSSSIAANDILNSFKSTQVEAGNNSMSELVFKGNFGVQGLNVLLGRQFNDAPDAKTTTTFKSKDGSHYSVNYNFGRLTAGVERKTQEGSDTNGAATNSEKRTGKSAGLAYAVTKDLSLGLTYAEASTDAGTIAAPRPDEITKIIALGYNLGPVAVQAQYKDVEDASSVAANDGAIFAVRLSTAF